MSQNQQRVCNLSKQPQRLHYHGIVLGVAPDVTCDVALPTVSQSMRRSHLAARWVQRLCDAGLIRVYVGEPPAAVDATPDPVSADVPPAAVDTPPDPTPPVAPVAEQPPAVVAPSEPEQPTAPLAPSEPEQPPAVVTPARLSLDAFSALTPKNAKLDYLLKVCGHDAPDNLTHLQLNDLYEELFAPKE